MPFNDHDFITMVRHDDRKVDLPIEDNGAPDLLGKILGEKVRRSKAVKIGVQSGSISFLMS